MLGDSLEENLKPSGQAQQQTTQVSVYTLHTSKVFFSIQLQLNDLKLFEMQWENSVESK